MANPPKPVEQRRLLGNPGRRPLPAPAQIVIPASGEVPKPPAGLRKDGKQAWVTLWTAGRGWLSPTTDWPILSRLCLGYDEAEQHRRMLRREGYVVRGSQGQPVAHPAVGMLRSVESQITKWEGLCGFTPSDRSRLGLAEVQRVSKLDDLLSRRRDRDEAEPAAV